MKRIILLGLIIFLASCIQVEYGTTRNTTGMNGPMHGGLGPMHDMPMHGSMDLASEEEFLVEMIPHHQEAVYTSRLIANSTDNPQLRALANRIVAAQEKEIAMMQRWLQKDYDSGYDASYEENISPATVISVSQRAADARTPAMIAKEMTERFPWSEYALIDASWGQGRKLDSERTATIYNQLRKQGYEGVTGVAGGLTASNVKRVISDLHEQILGNPAFAIDALSGLRTGDGGKESSLDLGATKRYLDNAWYAYQENILNAP